MIYQGTLEANGRWASASYNPGWGEPGEWYMKFSDGTSYTIDNVGGMGTQDEFLQILSEDKYRDEVIRNNWSLVGDSDDVILRVLKFVGYDETAKRADEKRIEAAKAEILDFAHKIADSLGVAGVPANVTKFDSVLKNSQWVADTAAQRIRVYEAVKNGETVGLGWTNKSYLRNFTESPRVHRVRRIMAESQN